MQKVLNSVQTWGIRRGRKRSGASARLGWVRFSGLWLGADGSREYVSKVWALVKGLGFRVLRFWVLVLRFLALGFYGYVFWVAGFRALGSWF